MTTPGDIFADLSAQPGTEQTQTLFESAGARIERIVSRSSASPPGFWYDQEHDEWVMVLRGVAVLQFTNNESVRMTAGQWLLIPRHEKHRVESTSEETVWLAVHAMQA